jgi:DNA-binding NarL/FixJ family response regulator
MPLKVLLADDHDLIREGLRALLENEPDLVVVGEADNGRDAVRLARDLQPNVIVMDIAMPDLNGIDATTQVVAQAPRTRIIALSMHSDRRFVAAALKAGAAGYLLKNCAFAELADAIRTVAANQTYLSPRIAGVVVDDYVSRLPVAADASGPALTPREREVLQLLAEGKATKQIAAALHASVSTIETHRRHIMNKLGLHSVAELTKYAIREGLTTSEQ